MKRTVSLAVVVGLMLVVLSASPALAVALRVGPARVEFDVPANGSTEVTFRVYDFSGDVAVELEDIPLRVEPEVVTVEAVEGGAPITLSFYGDKSLGSQTFKGIVYFSPASGGMVSLRVGVRATVNHALTEVTTKVVAPGITTTDISGVINEAGVILDNVAKVVSEDKKAKIEIAQGTKALTAEGKALQEIRVEQLSEVIDTPEFSIIGPAYNIGPNGATFEPAMKLRLSYYANKCKEAGVAEEDVVIASYDADQGWVELHSEVDTASHVVTAGVSHFTQFAVVAPGATPDAQSQTRGMPLTTVIIIVASLVFAGLVVLLIKLARSRF